MSLHVNRAGKVLPVPLLVCTPVDDSLLLAHEVSQRLLQVKVNVKGAVEATRPTGANTILLNSLTAARLQHKIHVA
jgi:hypothetical protein